MSDILINIEQGTLRGTTGIDIDGNMYYAFLGIPYAKPPIGKLRFKAPQPAENWSGIKDVTKNGSGCYSREFVTRTTVGSEDCLFLNIFTPELPNKERTNLKPVMVYIHGGAFIAGSNDSRMYGPDFLITEDVVLVVINYRIGLLGFLAFDDPKLEALGNAGCKDMVMALKWVQSNIREFGGDPNNVTVFGESAGGGAVHFLILSELSKGFFHKAIIQSGSALNPWSLAKPSPADLARAVNCPYTKDEEILNYLQDLPVDKILEGQDKLTDKFQANFVRQFGPVVEKGIPNKSTFLSDYPLDLILQGKYNHVPIIFGYTAKEGIFFEMLEKKWNQGLVIEDFETVVPHWFKLERGSHISRSIANKIKQFYISDNSSYLGNREEMCLVHSDAYFIRGVYDSVRNHLISSKEPIYFYRFSIEANLNFYKKFGHLQLSGASHADDLGYLFKTFLTPDEMDPNSIEMKSVRRMVKLWTNFAKTGDPNPIVNVMWKPATKDELNFLDIGEELKSGVNPDEDRMKFWDDVYDMRLNC